MTYKIEDAIGAFWGIPGITPFRLGETMDAETALNRAGLNWDVEKQPLSVTLPDGSEKLIKTHVCNVRSDNHEPIGIIGSDYVPINNRDTFDLAETVAQQSGATWIGGGYTRGGSRVHAILALDKALDLGIRGEDILPLLIVSNGHDGGLALRIRVAPMRLVCLNGQLVPTEVSHDWRTRHTRNVNTRVEEARNALNLAERYMASVEAQAQTLLAKKLDARAFGRFLERLVPMPHDLTPEEITDGGRRVTNIETVRAAIRAQREAPNLASIRTTAYGALQAVTAYATHDAPRRGDDARFRAVTQEHPLVQSATRMLVAV
jgi:phage/plasmid-like protein (TIGR03299 family)